MKFLNEWPARWAAANPERIAVSEVTRGAALSWRDLDRRAAALATFLLREGRIQPGDRVACLAENRIELVEAFFAVARLRACLVPMNTKLALPELERVMADASPRVLLASASLGVMARDLVQRSTKRPLVISLDGSIPGVDAISYTDVVSGPIDGAPREAVVDEADPWLVLYTSGSTGKPKGALITHRQIVSNAAHTMIACDLVSGDSTITYTPLFYTGGWNVLSSPLWYRGGTVNLMPAFDAEQILSLVARRRVTTLFGVPTTLTAMRDAASFASTDLSSLRVLLVGGAACPRALAEAWMERGIALRQGYGLTEVGPNIFGLKPEDCLRKAGSIGRPNLHVETRVTDEQGNDVAAGQEGELRLRGPMMFGGYLGNEKATRDAIDEQGFFKTGDVVKKDEEGFFWIAGRKSDMFKSGGEKVYAGEVEAAIASHEFVAEVVVFGVPEATWGEVGRAVIVAKGGATLDPEALKGWLVSRIAKFKVPKSFVIVDALPRTETGKIARAVVKSKWAPAAPALVGASS